MIASANANALAACGMAAFAAAELRRNGLHGDDAMVREAAAASIAPLLRAAAIALELTGMMGEEHCAGVHDVIIDYINVPPAIDATARLVI